MGQQAAKEIDDAIGEVANIRASLTATGELLAQTYLDGAIVALRFAQNVLHLSDHQKVRLEPGNLTRIRFADGFPTSIFRRIEGRDLAVRGRMDGQGESARFRVDPSADVPPGCRPLVDLGAMLLKSADARGFAAQPVSAAMLFDALSTRSWYNYSTATRWSAGPAAALAIVSAVSGCVVRPLAAELRGTYLDLATLRLIEGLGWRRESASPNRP